MNISYNWLKEYIECNLTPNEMAEALTSIGLETGSVEEVQTIKGGLEGLVVGHVLTCIDHPNSDHLHITTVDLGNENVVQIVCGAANVAAGQKVVVATLGTKLYSEEGEFTIKKSKIRGEESFGMICAEDEIGVGTSHNGIIVLPSDVPTGTLAKDYYNVKSDYILEVDITPNRADACSHYGVARDLYAYLKQNNMPATLKKESADAFDKIRDLGKSEITVEVENAEHCNHYSGVYITGVKVAESPEWLQNKLKVIGLKPINNVVDITNYMLHAYGQPLHCFDADKIEGKKIIVKTATEGDKFTTLDGVERTLNSNDLTISNAKAPMCLAGVFGGLDSGATDSTVNIFLESAYFNPTTVRKTARRHGLNTDSSFRFERGTDPNSVIPCLKLAAIMIKEIASAEHVSEVVEVKAKEAEHFSVELCYDRVNKLIGKEIEPATVKSIVESLEMNVEKETAEGLLLNVPPYRVDVQRECDVIEDILRIYGYNNVEIGSTLKSSLTTKGEYDRSNKLQNLVAEQLVGGGFNEILNNSLTKAAYYEGLSKYKPENLVMLLNPLSTDLNAMRQTLLFGGLESISHNSNRQNSDLKFFEFGNCYKYTAEKKNDEKILAPYSENYHLGLWVTGKHIKNSWAHADEPTSIFILKSYVNNILLRLGVNITEISTQKSLDNVYETAVNYVSKRGKVIVTLGVVSKKILKSMDIANEVYYADINWNEILKETAKHSVSFKEIPKYPAVKRDLALLIDKEIEFEQIQTLAYETERKLLKDVRLFDVYEGKNLEAGKKSYAVSFTLQDENQTLNDKSIDKIMSKLIKVYEDKLNAKLR
ncbi:MAG: phenylalanine--tRNA ligase subunit beta [Bacteroides sp.]|nr:phenylalanine--tRNA ligase subunit beta [Bacteroides sp.]